VAAPALDGTVSGSTPFSIAWPAARETGTGIARYELARSVDGGSWEWIRLPLPTIRKVYLDLLHPHDYRFRVRAVDGAGNVGAWAQASVFRVQQLTEATARLSLSAGWTRRSWTGYLGDSGLLSGVRGATATLSFTGHQIAWFGTRGPTFGSADVFVDGRHVTTVNLNRSSTAARRILFRHVWPTPGAHTLVIRVVGTSGHPSVDIDGFVLVDPPSPYPILVGAGDISLCSTTGDSQTAALLDEIPGRIFVAGDAAYPDGTVSQFRDCYGPTWGRWRLRTSPTPGDHEYNTRGAAPYFAYFGARAGTAGKGFYAYDLGTWRIYVLNSNCEFVPCASGSEQERWLRADLAAHPRRCVAAVWHHPVFSSGYHGNNAQAAPLWRALEDAGAEIVLSGDDHDYERFAPQTWTGQADPDGIRQFVVGTGGVTLRPFRTIRANSERRSSTTLGVLSLSLGITRYGWRFVPVSGATFTDSGTTSCH
jgi:hypothetical protein